MSPNLVKNLQTTKFSQPTLAEKLAIKQEGRPKPNLHSNQQVEENSTQDVLSPIFMSNVGGYVSLKLQMHYFVFVSFLGEAYKLCN